MPTLRRLTGIAGAITIATLGALAVRTALDVRRGERNFPPAGKIAEIDGTRLHYVERGNGRPVVLLHGNPGFVQDFTLGSDNLVDALARDHRVVVVDRPGHGYSERPSDAGTTPREQARLIHDLLQRLGVERPILVGHSWGGGLALVYAERYPREIAGLVLAGTRAYPSAARPDPVYALNRTPVVGTLFRATLLPPVGQRLLGKRLTAAYAPDTVHRDHLAAARALWMRPSQVAATVWDTRDLQLALADASRHYGQLALPVIILVGDHDTGIADSRRLAAAIPGATLHMLPNAGHELPLTHPGELAAAVRAIP
jgi:pimeloyl-ACP methyl ester carboxylesterase